MTESVQPLKIQLDKSERRLVIVWSDGFRNSFPWAFLRAHCPSAGEKVAREDANPLAVLNKVPSSELTNVRLVGTYALGLDWADGHNAGIYTWEYLRNLGDDPAVETTAYA